MPVSVNLEPGGTLAIHGEAGRKQEEWQRVEET